MNRDDEELVDIDDEELEETEDWREELDPCLDDSVLSYVEVAFDGKVEFDIRRFPCFRANENIDLAITARMKIDARIVPDDGVNRFQIVCEVPNP